MPLPVWARAHGAPLFAAQIRSRPDEFVVFEDLRIEFSGAGEHDYLHVEKTGANTEWVARRLASHAGVRAGDVGYAGLKDRHAVTRQWFSVPRRQAPDWGSFSIDGVRVLEIRRHARKLRRGAHRANEFRILLRGELPAGDELETRMAAIAALGVPTYFGEQRFGCGGANLDLADAWAAGTRLPRHRRGFAISAARSFLFNAALDARVRDATWNRILPGDWANLDGSGSVFDVAEADDELEARCARMDIHPAGWLPGVGAPVIDPAPDRPAWTAALQHAGVRAAHRSFRVCPRNLRWFRPEQGLEVGFSRPRGAYATAVIGEIADARDAVRSAGTAGSR